MDYSGCLFDFEKLEVYRRSLSFTDRVFTLTAQFSRDIQYSLGDQFRRSALSICNNLAEGSRKSGRAKKQFYEYAFDSARECVPMIAIATKQQHIDKDTENHLRSECIQICNMLYKLINSIRI